MTRTLDEILAELTPTQRQFIVARHTVTTDVKAAATIGLNAKTVSLWRREGAPIDEALDALNLDAVKAASLILTEAAAKAAETLVDELRSGAKDRVRAAVEILNRIGLSEVKRIEADVTAGLGILVVLDEPADLEV